MRTARCVAPWKNCHQCSRMPGECGKRPTCSVLLYLLGEIAARTVHARHRGSPVAFFLFEVASLVGFVHAHGFIVFHSCLKLCTLPQPIFASSSNGFAAMFFLLGVVLISTETWQVSSLCRPGGIFWLAPGQACLVLESVHWRGIGVRGCCLGR